MGLFEQCFWILAMLLTPEVIYNFAQYTYSGHGPNDFIKCCRTGMSRLRYRA